MPESLPPIAIVAYNRPHSLQRLLNSLNSARYPAFEIKLIISIDKSGGKEVETVARTFKWFHGSKEIVIREVRMGLRRHVMAVSSCAEEHGSVIVLEDDLVVAESFYYYSIGALDYYANDPLVAGISLYKHEWNYVANRCFTPGWTAQDTYLMQIPQSWGQVYSRRMWHSFRKWFEKGAEFGSLDSSFVPRCVRDWPESSWLKLYANYMVENGLFFVYPYKPLATNFSDQGQHVARITNRFQLPLLYGLKEHWEFSRATTLKKYDAFFEYILGSCDSLSGDDCELDLFGTKENFQKRYVISSRALPYVRVEGYGLKLRPHEENILGKVHGDFFFRYDTAQRAKPPRQGGLNRLSKVCEYDFKRSPSFSILVALNLAFMLEFLQRLLGRATKLKQQIFKR